MKRSHQVPKLTLLKITRVDMEVTSLLVDSVMEHPKALVHAWLAQTGEHSQESLCLWPP